MKMETAEVIAKAEWAIDPAHSEVSFIVKHLMITNIRGAFKEFDARIYTTTEDFMTVEIDFWMNPASIDTGDKRRDEHLRSSDFFDVKNHQQITFTGNTFKKAKDYGSYELCGELTMKGVSKQIKLNVEFGGVMKDAWGNENAGFSVNGKISREDWGLTWNHILEAGSVMVSDEITINCDIQLIKQ